MVKFALFAKLEAKPGKEKELEEFLRSALPLAQEENQTINWYALKFNDSTFGIFDSFNDEEGRKAHLTGKIAAALMAKASELLVSNPNIEQVEILEAK